MSMDAGQGQPPSTDRTARAARYGADCIRWALIGNGIAIVLAVSLLPIPAGTGIRPMGHTAMIFLVALAMIGGALPGALIALWRGHWQLGIVGCVLALLPLPLFIASMHLVCNLRHLTLED
jgi:hypothetical protein